MAQRRSIGFLHSYLSGGPIAEAGPNLAIVGELRQKSRPVARILQDSPLELRETWLRWPFRPSERPKHGCDRSRRASAGQPLARRDARDAVAELADGSDQPRPDR